MEYKKQLVRFSMNKINNAAFFLFLITFFVGLVVNLLAMKRPLLISTKVYWDILIIVAIFGIGLFVHEGIHALTALLFCGCKKQDISFGMNLKAGVLYCHVNKPMSVKQYRLMLITPVIITGIIPLIISMFLGNLLLVAVFCMLVSGGAGDLCMLYELRKYPADQLIEDHPSAPAFYLVYPSDNTPENFAEVTAEQEEELLADMKKAPTISTKEGKKKNGMFKVYAVLIFLCLVVFALFLIALFMRLL